LQAACGGGAGLRLGGFFDFYGLSWIGPGLQVFMQAGIFFLCATLLVFLAFCWHPRWRLRGAGVAPVRGLCGAALTFFAAAPPQRK
jgi:hypothetical protein